jgi:hypothetical protein
MRGAANEPGKGHCRDSIFFANHVSRETGGSLELARWRSNLRQDTGVRKPPERRLAIKKGHPHLRMPY